MPNSSERISMNSAKANFALKVLEAVEKHGDDMKLICLYLKRSRQNTAYWLRKMRDLGLLERMQSYPYSIHKLTLFGERCKKNLGQSEKSLFWRCHNLIVGFEIKSFGSLDWNIYHRKGMIRPMKNWFYAEEKIKDSIGDWKIHIQSTGLLKIYCPEKYDVDPNKAFGNMEEIAMRIADKYKEKFGLNLGLMKRIRNGHKELVNSEKLAVILGHSRVGDVWIDASTGTERLEESESETTLEDLLSIPKRIQSLETHIFKQTEVMDKFSKQIELHLEAINKIGTAIENLEKTVKKLDDKP